MNANEDEEEEEDESDEEFLDSMEIVKVSLFIKNTSTFNFL